MAYPNVQTNFPTLKDLVDRYRAGHLNSLYVAVGSIIAAMANPPQTVVVAKARGDYTALSSAVAAITDSSASKPYAILVMPGIYETSNVTLPDYVSLVGLDPHSCILKSTTANTDYVIQPGGNSCIMNLGITNSSTVSVVAGQAWCIYVQDDTVRIENCILTNTGSASVGLVVGGWLGIAGTSTVQIWNTQMLMASTTFVNNAGILQTGAAATNIYLHHCDLRITSGPTGADSAYCVDMGDGAVYIYDSVLYSTAIVIEVITTAQVQAERCTLVSTANNAIPIHAETSNATLYDCTILKHGSATVCIYTDVAHNIRVAHCRMNLASPIHANLTNLIAMPYNVQDTDV